MKGHQKYHTSSTVRSIFVHLVSYPSERTTKHHNSAGTGPILERHRPVTAHPRWCCTDMLALHDIHFGWKEYITITMPVNVTVPHHSDVIMSSIASQITGVSIAYSTVCSGTDQRKHQSSTSLAFVRGIHRWPVNSPHKRPVTRKMFPFDDVIMKRCWATPRHSGDYKLVSIYECMHHFMIRSCENSTPLGMFRLKAGQLLCMDVWQVSW